ncbi:MAG: UDP-N-acetylmuramoyl-L-alanyl-D-glutamate--2,6-diaminopimelate ligase [Candidatus Moranbacteria bacterium]|nr:UDP-N-acetylmuramoyl-L-alanyl-D-glutamate--2,6-diaminopimelate ligase [Candidatus Moranbacteria bacterium]
MKKLIPQSIKNIYHLAQAVVANFAYGFPSRNIKVIGVTGTNGKTTTCQMIAKILEEAGHTVAMASTINFKLGAEEWVNVTKYTTLSPFATQKFIKKAVEAKCDYLILETSSHSLDQCRVWGIHYAVAVITNVTREHLDYHKTIEQYRQAKAKLFGMADVAVVNLDMEKPEEFLQYNNAVKFGYSLKDTNHKIQDTKKSQISNLKSQNIFANNIKLDIYNSAFQVSGCEFKINLPGEFNIENSLAAVAVGISQNISLEQSANALAKITGVAGRLESIANDKNLNVMIDYAVTPDSLQKLYQYLTSVKKTDSRIIAVFGSCGERDRGKRPLMGEIVSASADYVIVTNEDPYHEDPQQIINEVASGVKNKTEGQNFWKIFDRREAIAKALSLAKANDIVIVTGKGAEETMAVGDQRIEWNDKKVIQEELAKIKV